MLDAFFWDTLLMRIESGQVLPIVGPGLLKFDYQGKKVSLSEILALKLADDFSLEVPTTATLFDLNQLLSHPGFPKDKRAIAYPRIKLHLEKLALEPPLALRKLARISALNLFISATFDPLLCQAIDQERFRGESKTQRIAYSFRKVRDLPSVEERGSQSIVYQLFGQAEPSPSFAVTEEDYLEFFNALLGDRSRVRNLTELLDQRDLLLIGMGFPDWLNRFLLRFAKQNRLSAQRDSNEVIADQVASQDPRFAAFISNFSQQTYLYDDGGSEEFVDELYRRWIEKYPEADDSSSGKPADENPIPVDLSNHHQPIFLSYASEDFEAAARIRDALVESGATVWFDKKPDTVEESLEPGIDYRREITSKIRQCSVFLPVISQAVSYRGDRFFRYEWSLAIDRLPFFTGLNRRFIMPVIIDETSLYTNGVPEAFGLLHAVRAPSGEISKRDCQSIAAAAAETTGGMA